MAKDVLNTGQIMTFEFKIEKRESTHFHQNIEIFCVLEGKAALTVGDRTFNAQSGDIIIINSNKRHAYESAEDVLIGRFEIDFAALCHIMNTNQVLFWCNSVINKNSAFDEMRDLMRNIFSQYFDKDPQSYVYTQSLIYQLLKVILDNFLIRSDDRRFAAEKNTEEDRLTEITNYINMNYKKRLSLSELAGQLYLSVPYLSKYIKRHLGMNFVDYLNSVRLFHAVDDLLYTDYSITNIAIDNGFANTAAFNELFKKEYGQTPSEYRRQMKESGGRARTAADNQQRIEERVSAYLDTHMPAARPAVSSAGHARIAMDVQDKKPYRMHWKNIINVGFASDLLRSDTQEHVRILRSDLGFKYARIWDIFSPEMMLNTNDEHFNYNFERIDRVLDFLVQIHMTPYIEMGYKPKELHRTLNDYVFYERREIPFKTVEHAQAFFSAFARHLMNRYSMRELSGWVFELWSGEDFGEEVQRTRQYFETFEALYSAFKRLSPEITIGGGGIGIQAGSQNLKNLVAQWEKQKHLPDFLSLYFYPYVEGVEAGTAYGRPSSDKDFLKNQLLMVRETLEPTRFREVPIHISEWSSTVSNRNILNDSCYKAAYIVKSMIDSIGMADEIGYWVGTDLFAEYFDSKKILFGGCGLMSKDGIKKPAFFAYRYLNGMEPYLVGKDDHCLVTTDGHDNYGIICHNYCHLNYKYYLKREDEIEVNQLERLFADSDRIELSLQIKGVRRGKYKIKIYSMSPEHGSALGEWMEMGTDRELMREDIEYLQRICTPRIRVMEYEATEPELNFDVQIVPHEIKALQVFYLYE